MCMFRKSPNYKQRLRTVLLQKPERVDSYESTHVPHDKQFCFLDRLQRDIRDGCKPRKVEKQIGMLIRNELLTVQFKTKHQILHFWVFTEIVQEVLSILLAHNYGSLVAILYLKCLIIDFTAGVFCIWSCVMIQHIDNRNQADAALPKGEQGVLNHPMTDSSDSSDS